MKSLGQKVWKKKTKSKKRSKKRKAFRKKLRRVVLSQSKSPYQPPSAMSGDSFWKNYANVFSWQQNYGHYINHNYSNPYFPRRPENPSYEVEQSREFTKPNQIYGKNCSPVEDIDVNDVSDTGSEDEFVVTEEMMKFLEISLRHKQERAINKAKDMSRDQNMKTLNLPERDNILECQAPKEKTVNATRTEEMSDLYGTSAAMIMGMETALQLTFNRNCDLYKPSFWPFVPLNFQLADQELHL